MDRSSRPAAMQRSGRGPARTAALSAAQALRHGIVGGSGGHCCTTGPTSASHREGGWNVDELRVGRAAPDRRMSADELSLFQLALTTRGVSREAFLAAHPAPFLV